MKECAECILYPAATSEVFFSALKWKYLKAEFLTFLKVAIYRSWWYAIEGHCAGLGENDHLFRWTAQFS